MVSFLKKDVISVNLLTFAAQSWSHCHGLLPPDKSCLSSCCSFQSPGRILKLYFEES